jgi:hypothetical protein
MQGSYTPNNAVYSVKGNTFAVAERGYAADPGIWMSWDLGVNWTKVLPNLGSIMSVEIDPFDENIVMAWGDHVFLRSTDGGVTWLISGGTLYQPTATTLDATGVV